MSKDIGIVVFANAKDYFLTKICVSSIRYFYPEIDIFLVKDELNGKFNTKTLERNFNVKHLKLSKKYFGWSAAKLHFLIECEKDRLFLCLDSDIIFIGPVLNKFVTINSDFIVSPEFNPSAEHISKNYFPDLNKCINYFPSYRFPGYVFNAGQTVVNPSKIHQSNLSKVFNSEEFPYYLDYETFPLVDQSILNVLLPSLHIDDKISLDTVEFMCWAPDFFDKNNDIQVLVGNNELLIHYAGCVRNRNLEKMLGSNVLRFFQDRYEKKLNCLEFIKHRFQNMLNGIDTVTNIKYILNRIAIKIGMK